MQGSNNFFCFRVRIPDDVHVSVFGPIPSSIMMQPESRAAARVPNSSDHPKDLPPTHVAFDMPPKSWQNGMELTLPELTEAIKYDLFPRYASAG